MTIKIGITDCSKFGNYEKWISEEAGVEVIRLSYKKDNFSDITQCNGIILSGGEDVHPRFYDRQEYVELCHEIDETRDEFEWKVLQYTEEKQLPLLGICRGMQIANVYFGGTLIPDIPLFRQAAHSRFPEKDRRHIVRVDPSSELKKIVGVESGEVNSAHHQSADKAGNGLIANAFSPDGIIEGMEREHKQGRPFLLLVQWHPERMTDQENPFSVNIKNSFLDAVKTGMPG